MRVALLMLLALPLLPAHGADVYRCVTDSGITRYSATPCEDGESRKLDIESRDTDAAAVDERIQERKERIASLEQAEAAAAEADRKAAEEAAKREQACAAARERLQKLMVARRVRTGEGKEQRYLDSAEIVQRRQEAQDKVNELCGK